MLKKTFTIFKNKYFLATLFFVGWLLFFDRHNFISQYKLRAELNKLQEEKTFFLEEIKSDSQKLHELISNPATLEKFAREKYLMKKDDEEIFVIVEE